MCYTRQVTEGLPFPIILLLSFSPTVRCNPWLLSGRNSLHIFIYSINIYCTLLWVRPSTVCICGDAVGSERDQALCSWIHGVYWNIHQTCIFLTQKCIFLTHCNKHEKVQSAVRDGCKATSVATLSILHSAC